MHTAVPDDPQTLWLTTTTISGTPLTTPQDGLYNSVTVTYRSNAGAVIAGAGTAAAAGFAFGPAGGIIGGIVGGIAALPISPHIVPAQPSTIPTITDYICPSDQGPAFPDLSNVASNPPPSLVLPVAIHAADARPYASQTDAKSDTHTAAICWHILPNGAHLHDATAAPTRGSAPSAPRKPIDGDGWLYRVVAADDPSQPPKDPNQPAGTRAADYFASKTTRTDFPYSACRQVAIQITWWQALADSLQGLKKGDEPNTLSVSYGAVVADPAYVYKADVSKGATITFKPTCGANVSVSPDTSFSTNASAAVTAAEGIYKAEQTWATSKAK
jgi:hypothetical protein